MTTRTIPLATLPAVLTMQHIGFAFGDGGAFALEVDTFEVAAGERVACIGPSGSGKTTLLHLAAGILAPDRGRVTVGGHCWGDMAEGARRQRRLDTVGLVFQEFELLDYLTVEDNVLLPYAVQRRRKVDPEVRARADRLLGATGLEAQRRRKPGRLSQGERQRVALCRALVTDPALVLADEPTGNLDPHAGAAVLDLLLAQVGHSDAALLMVTHNHGLLGAFDRVVELAIEGCRTVVR